MPLQTANSISENRISKNLPSIEADFYYIVPSAEKPFTYVYEPPTGTPSNNIVYKIHRLPVHNGRSLSSPPTLDQRGFSFLSAPSAVHDFYNEDEIRSVYYRETAELVERVTGAARVLVFDHNVRNAPKARQGVQGVKEPVKRVHNDFTAQSGYRRSRDELIRLGAGNPEILLERRFSIVNIWRPIAHPVEDSPLAICAAPSIAPEDWVASDLIYRERVGETYLTTYNPSHEWFYFPHMQPDEVLLIKCFDSDESIPARFTAHTAIDDPTSPPGAIPRASIELRSLVFYTEP